MEASHCLRRAVPTGPISAGSVVDEERFSELLLVELEGRLKVMVRQESSVVPIADSSDDELVSGSEETRCPMTSLRSNPHDTAVEKNTDISGIEEEARRGDPPNR